MFAHKGILLLLVCHIMRYPFLSKNRMALSMSRSAAKVFFFIELVEGPFRAGVDENLLI
jgi:hypothetical protein